MVPLAMNVFQSIDVTAEWIATMLFFGGGLMLITAWVICARLGRIRWGLQATNDLLRKIAADAASAEASRTVRGPSTAVGMTEGKRPPLPPPTLPKTEPDVYKL